MDYRHAIARAAVLVNGQRGTLTFVNKACTRARVRIEYENGSTYHWEGRLSEVRLQKEQLMLIDKNQVARMMGVEPRTVNQWWHIAKTSGPGRKSEPMPAPQGRAKNRLWWDADEVLQWAQATGRKVVMWPPV